MALNLSPSSHIAQISVAKIKTTNAMVRADKHNNRLGSKPPAHIDMRRESLNSILVNNVKETPLIDVINRVTGGNYTAEDANDIDKTNLYYAAGQKIHAKAILAGECKTGYPGDLKWVKFDEFDRIIDLPADVVPDVEEGHFMYPADMDEFRTWQERTVEYLKTRFGEKNVLQVQCHMDESVPHIHAIFTPIYENERGEERLNFNHFVDGPKDLAKMQTEYAEIFDDLGYTRGAEWSTNKGRVKSMTAAKVRAMAALSFDSVPQPIPKTEIDRAKNSHDSAEKDAMLDKLSMNVDTIFSYAEHLASVNTISQVQLDQRKFDGSRLETALKQNDDLKKELRKSDEKLAEITAQMNTRIKKLEAELSAQEMRKKGMELYADKDLAQNVQKLDEIWIADGKSWYKEHGFSFEEDREKDEPNTNEPVTTK